MNDATPAGLASAFRTRAGDAAGAPPVLLQADVSVAEAIARMAAAQQSVAVVIDEYGGVAGIVTEQDVLRRVAFKKPPDAACSEVMTSPVKTLGAEERLYQAIAAMRRNRLRHMPVVDSGGRPIGMLTLADALSAANARIVSQLERLSYEPTVASMADARAGQAEIAAELIADGVRGPEIQAWLSDFNNELHARVAEICVERMRRSVAGQPPVPFALIVMGSGGRGESGLTPDQDNGLVLADYPDREHRAVDLWFRCFSQRATQALAKLGFPFCRGGVMATSPFGASRCRSGARSSPIGCAGGTRRCCGAPISSSTSGASGASSRWPMRFASTSERPFGRRPASWSRWPGRTMSMKSR